MNHRRIQIAGQSYKAERELAVKDGGSSGLSSEPWYAVVLDPTMGACIDERVPEGYHPTMRDCHAAIRVHVAKRSPT